MMKINQKNLVKGVNNYLVVFDSNINFFGSDLDTLWIRQRIRKRQKER